MNIKNTSILFIWLFSITLLLLYGLKDDYAAMLPLLALYGLLIAYGIFWIVGNSLLWNEYYDSKKYLAFLLNLPVIIFLITGAIYIIDPVTPRVALTFEIMDQDGKALKGTEISTSGLNDLEAYFLKETYLLKNKNSIKIVRRKKSLRPFKISKDGYYPSNVSFNSVKDEKVVNGVLWPFRRIEPWNSKINVTLRKIKKPIPLYVKGVRNTFENGEYGYDLIEGDWVSPKGKGKAVHINFILQGGEKDKKELFVEIAGKNNGFQKRPLDKRNYNLLQPAHTAPSSGYKNKIEISPDHYGGWLTASFFFRVRKNPSDESSGLLYGKMIDSIQFSQYREPTQNRSLYKYQKANIKFRYYLNPKNNDKNLEFDSTKNLLSDQGFIQPPLYK